MARLATIRDNGIAAQINRKAVAMPDSRNAAAYWSHFYHQSREGDDAASSLLMMMNEDPTILRRIATPLEEEHTKNIVNEVARDRVGIYTAVSKEYAVAVAENLIGDAAYKAGVKAIKTGNGETGALIGLHTGKPLFENAARIASPSAVKKGLENSLTRIRISEFTANNIIKADGTINRAGTARYDATQTAALPTDERKEYDAGVGFQYTKEQDPTHFQ